MQTVNALTSCRIIQSFRVQQIAGMFDLDVPAVSRQQYSVTVPDLEEPWRIGAIVGPSGSGKSTVARQAFHHHMRGDGDWPRNKSVLEGFDPHISIRDVTQMLSAVGFSSPPGWLRPFRALSNGEQFRCNLARALIDPAELVVYDEFSSVVDRTVAKIGSHAIASCLRAGRCGAKRFVAVTCHYDVLDWLEAEWVLDMASMRLARGRLRRPKIKLRFGRCPHEIWQLFKRHHYLSAELHSSAACYLMELEGVPVAFAAVLPVIGLKARWRITRLVVLPDFQGVGIGRAMLEAVSARYPAMNITTSHPAMIRSLQASKIWRCVGVKPFGANQHCGILSGKLTGSRRSTSSGRRVVSFQFRGKKVIV